MTTPRKRPRLRFTLRTLAIVVTLVCCYAACWGPTKKWGPTALGGGEYTVAVAPLIVETANSPPYNSALVVFPNGETAISGRRYYYVWFFGHVTKLPFERDVGLTPVEEVTAAHFAGTESFSGQSVPLPNFEGLPTSAPQD